MGRKNQNKSPKAAAASPITAPNAETKEDSTKKLKTLVQSLLHLTLQPAHANVLKELDAIKEIYAIAERIKTVEEPLNAQYSVTDRTDDAAIERFVAWLKEGGAKFDGLSIARFARFDLGVKAKTDFKAGGLMISIPKKLMLCLEGRTKTNLLPLLESDGILENMPNVVLAVLLLMEKFSKKSYWKPYIDVLPQTYSTVLYYTVDELEELIGSPMLKEALAQIKNIYRQYAYFHRLVHNSQEAVCRVLRKGFTLEQYCWAVSTVMTRQNFVPSNNRTVMNLNVLIPFWDMCNHSNGFLSTDYNTDTRRSESYAMRDFKAGEQVFIFYGERSNSEFFIHNGFVYEENANDYYKLTLGVSQADPLREKRSQLLSKINITSSKPFNLWGAAGSPFDGLLLAFLRIFNMNEEQLEHWLSSDRALNLEHLDCALDTSLEKKVWNFLQARIKLLLSAYRTTFEDDEKLLADDRLTERRKLAVRMRFSEKRILRNVLATVDQIVKLY